jgi:hypothetical protein
LIAKIVGLIIVGAGFFISYTDAPIGVAMIMVGLIAQMFDKKKLVDNHV